MRSLVSFIFTLDAIVLSFVATALWLTLKPASRAGRRIALALSLFYLVLSTYGINVALVRLLESGFEPFSLADVADAPQRPTAIVVLGSGSVTVRDWDDHEFSSVDASAGARVLEAVRVYQLMAGGRDRGEGLWVISSGGKVHDADRDAATGITMRDALVELGVPGHRVLLEGKARNTYEEALEVKQMLPSLGRPQLVLVTSGLHMRRSLGAFRSVGIDPVPAIARSPVWSTTWRERLLPSPLGLWQGSNAAHEIIGLTYYAVSGRYSRTVRQ